MSTAKIGLVKRTISDLSFAMSRDAFALDRELSRTLPRQNQVDRLTAEIATNKERVKSLRAQLAELEMEA